MSQVITAPDETIPAYCSVFLAGGISNCHDWQKDVISELEFDHISIFNPRQAKFDITDKNASLRQIAWEYERLERMDVFSIYFCAGESDQPICMYELGRNILRMQNRFPSDWQKRIVISIEDGYKRKEDVLIQTRLCAPDLVIEPYATPEFHAHYIRNCVRRLLT